MNGLGSTKLDMIFLKFTVEIFEWFLVSVFKNLRFGNSSLGLIRGFYIKLDQLVSDQMNISFLWIP